MNPKFLEWSQLSRGNMALTDGSSIRELVNQASVLLAPLDPRTAQEITRHADHFSLGPALSLLERWLLFDDVAVDIVAVASSLPGNLLREAATESSAKSYMDPTTSPGEERHKRLELALKRKLLEDLPLLNFHQITAEINLKFTAIPQDVFTRCLEILSRGSSTLAQVAPQVEWHEYGFGDYKRFGENLALYYGNAGLLARSNLGIERTLVYYEASAAMGASLILHPDRSEEAAAIERASADAYQALREVLHRSFEKPLLRELETLGLKQDFNFTGPLFKIIADAGAARASIIEAARETKDSAPARSFRKWVGELQLALDAKTPRGKIEVLRLLREIQDVSSKWVGDLNVREGVYHRRRNLSLSWIPRVGALLEILELKIDDPILSRKGYLQFISSWYER